MEERPKDYRTHYPSDVSDGEWEFCAPYLTLMDPEAPQQLYPLRALFNALRYIAKTGVQWRYLPENFPPYHAVYQQAQRWIRAGVLETMASDLRKLLRMLQDRASEPSAVILDGRTLQSVP
jgi:transposase